MGRYGRQRNHIIRTETTDGVWEDTGRPRPLYVAWCGEKAHTTVSMDRYESDASCTKCSAAFFKDRSGGVTIEKITPPEKYEDPRPYGIGPFGTKSAYRIMRDGECYGVLFMPAGWGKKWSVHRLTTSTNRAGEMIVAKDEKPATMLRYDRDVHGKKREVGTPTYQGSSFKVREPYKTDANHFASKERALSEVADMIDDGFLPSETDVIAKWEKDRADLEETRRIWEAQRIEREQREAEAAARAQDELDLITIAFAEMLTEGKITNYQREAVMLAAKRMNIKALDF